MRDANLMDFTRMPARHFKSATAGAGLGAFVPDPHAEVDASVVAELLAECAAAGSTLIVGITGSVAAGKSTLSSAIASHLHSTLRIESISTDGFLYPNETLISRGLIMRKGYPETYDTGLLSGVLQRVRWGPVRVPAYSHVTYDRMPDLDRTIDRPDILLVEGLGFSLGGYQRSPAALLDLLLYIDAGEDDLEAWYVARFMEFWREAETNPQSFYARFRGMGEAEAEAFARQVWAGVNLPNVRENIAPVKREADILLTKAADHSMTLTLPAFGDGRAEA